MNAPLVVTNCTSRKRGAALPVTLRCEHLPPRLEDIAASWKETLRSAAPTHAVRMLYAGRTFSDAYKAARAIGGELFVASAGLGLIHEDDEAPTYDLTFADRQNPLAKVSATAKFTPSDWWATLGQIGLGRGRISDLVNRLNAPITLLAMPNGYLEMVAPDLETLEDRHLDRLRIFTSTAGAASLPSRLGRYVMPYDERLEAVPGYSGTRTDFAQRALLHFAEHLSAHRLSSAEGKALVLSSLDGLKARIIPPRTKASDAQIAALLRRKWRQHKGSSVQLLRYLRRDAQVACEQKRFQGIWASVKQEFLTGNGGSQ